MKCPICKSGQTQVKSTQKGDFLDGRFKSKPVMEALVKKYTESSVFRLRGCRKCKARFTSVEVMLSDEVEPSAESHRPGS